MKEGDKNTKFFHRVANIQKRSNYIGMLIADGALIDDENVFSKKLVDYYEDLFYEEEDKRPILDGLDFSSKNHKDATWLERNFEEVVMEALNSLNGDKAPSLDGMTLAFFQNCWIVKEDLLKVFEKFFTRAKFEKSFNSTSIALIL